MVGGKVVIEGTPFEDGADVTVIALEDTGTFELSPEDEAELVVRVVEADKDKFVDGDEVLAKLKKTR